MLPADFGSVSLAARAILERFFGENLGARRYCIQTGQGAV
jgi:hypothetical protein